MVGILVTAWQSMESIVGMMRFVEKLLQVEEMAVAEFAPKSATFGSLVDQRPQLSSRIRCSGLLSLEAADFVLEFADAGSGLSDAGFGLFGAG